MTLSASTDYPETLKKDKREVRLVKYFFLKSLFLFLLASKNVLKRFKNKHEAHEGPLRKKVFSWHVRVAL